MNTTPSRPTPETDAVAWVVAFGYQHLNEDIQVVDAEFAQKLERERDETAKQLEAMRDELQKVCQQRDAWAMRCDKLGVTAMREAIKEVSLQLTFAEKVSRTSVLHIYVYDALAKLQPFIKP